MKDDLRKKMLAAPIGKFLREAHLASFRVRIMNAFELRDPPISTVGDLVKLNGSDLLKLRAIGHETVRFLRNALSANGLELNDREQPDYGPVLFKPYVRPDYPE